MSQKRKDKGNIEQMNMLLVMPSLLPVHSDESCCTYEGFINILSQSYRISVVVPNDGNLSKAQLECEWRLASCLNTEHEHIQQMLKDSEDLPSFFKRFIEIAERRLKATGVSEKPWTDHNQNILIQLQQIGWNKVIGLVENFSSVEIRCYDRSHRHHKLRVNFNKDNSQARPSCVTDLPQEFDFHWSSTAQLNDLVAQFEGCLGNYQEFWNTVEEIDKNTWVLEPEHPNYSCTYRRIALGQNLSLHIVINPLQPLSLPECRILGAENVVAPLREKLNINLHLWDLDRSLLNNLQEVLEIDFPTPSDTNKEDLSVDCGICYSHQLGEEIPDIVCQHPPCSQAFHYTCLYEWLRNSSCRQSFNYVFGECPFCNKPIRVKIQMD